MHALLYVANRVKYKCVSPHDGQYYTVGDNGAEFVDLPKDAIVFNHKQTEELLKNGYSNSRGRMTSNNLAFVTGNAFMAGNDSFKTDYTSTSSSTDSSDKTEDDAKQTINFIEYILENIENRINISTNKIENYLDNTIDNNRKSLEYSRLVAESGKKSATLLQAQTIYTKKANDLLAKVPAAYRSLAQNGTLQIKDFLGEEQVEVAEAIEAYREYANKAAQTESDYLESIAQAAEYRAQEIDDIATDFENLTSVVEAKQSIINSRIDLLKETGNFVSENSYKQLIAESQKKLSELEREHSTLQNLLDKYVKSGDIKIGSDTWYEQKNRIDDVAVSINDCVKEIEEYQNAINDLSWEKLDYTINRFDSLANEMKDLENILGNSDLFNDGYYKNVWSGWTDEGIASLGLMAQTLELSKVKAQQYGEAIEELNDNKQLYSVSEYTEKLEDLQSKQRECIDSYQDAKQSIVDLTKTRIESIKTAIDEEIEAYGELIDKRKEALQSAKDEYDWNKSVTEQQANVDKLQKQIDAMQYSTDASTTAKRKQLEAQLNDEKASMADMYYNHSIETQQTALDNELELFTNEKDEEKEKLDDYLEDADEVIADALNKVKNNTRDVFNTLTSCGQEYGITLSDAIVDPWASGSSAIGSYNDTFTIYASQWTETLSGLKQQIDTLFSQDTFDYATINSGNMGKTAGGSPTTYEYNGQTRTGYIINGKTYTQDVADDKYRVPVGSIVTDSSGRKWKMTSAGGVLVGSQGQSNNQIKNNNTASQDSVKVGSSVTVKKSTTNFTTGQKMASWVPGSQFTVMQVNGKRVLIGRNGVATGWINLSDIVGYSNGISSVPNNMLAMVDELGEELQLTPDKNGRLQYLRKGTSIIPADISEKLMQLALDPNKTLEYSAPKPVSLSTVNNTMKLDMNFGSLVHVDSVSKDTLPELQKMVRTEFNGMMNEINNKLRRYTN